MNIIFIFIAVALDGFHFINCNVIPVCIEKDCDFQTTDGYRFYPLHGEDRLDFKVRVQKDAFLALTTSPSDSKQIEVSIGSSDNQKSAIFKSKSTKIETNTPNILSNSEYRSFWVQFKNGVVAVGRSGEREPFISWQDSNEYTVNYIGFRTRSNPGLWMIQNMDGVDCWIPAQNGKIPNGAVLGGKDKDDELLYVARAKHIDFFIPGKLKPNHHGTYVAKDGKEYSHSQYQVLVATTHEWIKYDGSVIPKGATRAGMTANGDPYYIGRASVTGENGAIAIGHILNRDRKCYIPFHHREHEHSSCEILVATCKIKYYK